MVSDYTPRRVVSLQPSATVILAAIGVLDRIVACTKYCADVCREVKSPDRTIVADSWTSQAEQITAVHPDLVIASVPYQEKAVVEILKSGARFLGLAPKTLADIYADIAAIAGIMGTPQRGNDVITKMRTEIEAIRQQADSGSRPTVFCEEWGKPLIASQVWVAELVEAAGGCFVGQPGLKTSIDEIGSLNPDVLIASWCGAGNRVPLEKIIRDRHWEDLRAAQTGRVYCIPDDFLNTPAPTLVHGLHALAAAIHPERFPAVPRVRRIESAAAPAEAKVSA